MSNPVVLSELLIRHWLVDSRLVRSAELSCLHLLALIAVVTFVIILQFILLNLNLVTDVEVTEAAAHAAYALGRTAGVSSGQVRVDGFIGCSRYVRLFQLGE